MPNLRQTQIQRSIKRVNEVTMVRWRNKLLELAEYGDEDRFFNAVHSFIAWWGTIPEKGRPSVMDLIAILKIADPDLGWRIEEGLFAVVDPNPPAVKGRGGGIYGTS